MSETKNFCLKDLCTKITDGSHFSPKDELKGLPMFSVKDMTENGFDYSRVKRISKSDFDALVKQGCQPEIDDIVIAKDGSVLKHVFRIKNVPDYVLLSSIAILRPNREIIHPDFLVYSIKNPTTTDTILSNFVSGSGVPRIVLKDFKNVEISLPALLEQKRIAETLSSLDDKIDLLHRQNKTLEALAETLFRQWFLEEADESWQTCKLDDVCSIQNGYAFSSRDYVPYKEGHLEVLKMGHIERGGGLRKDPKKDFVPREEKLKRWVLNKGDIIMAMTDMKDNVVILGVPAMIDVDNKYVLNQRVARIILKRTDKLISNYFLYVQMKNPEFIATLQSKANSGVQVNLSTEAIKDCDIIVPPLELQKGKGQAVIDLYVKLEKNNLQIKTLSQLRDTLLPKLMSGEVRLEI